MFVVPLCVVIAWAYDIPLSLDFHPFETGTLLLTVVLVTFLLTLTPTRTLTRTLTLTLTRTRTRTRTLTLTPTPTPTRCKRLLRDHDAAAVAAANAQLRDARDATVARAQAWQDSGALDAAQCEVGLLE